MPRNNFLIKVDLPLPLLPIIHIFEFVLLLVLFHKSNSVRPPFMSSPSIMELPSSCIDSKTKGNEAATVVVGIGSPKFS